MLHLFSILRLLLPIGFIAGTGLLLLGDIKKKKSLITLGLALYIISLSGTLILGEINAIKMFTVQYP